jgi:hypothetical protein
MAEWWQGGPFIGCIAPGLVAHRDHDERLVKIEPGSEDVLATL